MNRLHWEGLILLTAMAVAGGAGALIFLPFTQWLPSTEVKQALARPHRPAAARYFPPAPGDAEEPLREWVLLGARLLNPSSTSRWQGAQSHLNCSNCHFEGGLTPGGRNGGISLVGAAARYPRRAASGELETLAERINDCVRNNLDARPLALDSPEMLALCTCLQWMSKNVPVYTEVPWLGLPALELPALEQPAAPDARRFRLRCAVCHGPDGLGTEIAPPLWGPQSFTKASGLNSLGRLASFIYLNMPRFNPLLEPAEAFELAKFVLEQPRPLRSGDD